IADLAVADGEDDGGVLIVLKGEGGESLVIAIGLAEATAIAKELQELEFSRPLTHDLMRDIVDTLGARVDRVEILELRDGTYYAELVIVDSGGQTRRIDSRPSDAIALALRTGSPVFADEQILIQDDPEAQEFPPATDKESWKKILEGMTPEDFGKYKM
ncbi:unnamed protein product, partial [marine sediment metagenome]